MFSIGKKPFSDGISVVFSVFPLIFSLFWKHSLTFRLNKCKKTVKQKPALDQVYKAGEKR
ncbi:hypothetical protein NEICINOT_03004 [Neisseria cinerea ATCC 14685]|uniref:Uncharacterized protein n=1 Tax=Neisseria cinerea ATCC 14685 TaxID=546262 RepID=D0W041_NEICI|nr:hypothetical protein NEICINOT_03004 [Neisseria cinerea ATCC 14685]